MNEFERDLLASVKQALTGNFEGECVVHSPEAVKVLAKRGRPAGSTKSPATLRIDTDALKKWRASGKGWQTRAAELLALHAPS